MADSRPPARAPRAAKRKEPPSSERSIYFYRADAGLQTSGKPVALDLKPVLERVGELACADGERYLAQEDDNVLCAWVDSVEHQRMRLATIRRSGLPLIEQGGNLNGLNLTADQGLYEPIHIQVFDNNIIGVEFNFYGHRPSRLSSYLRRVTGNNLFPAFTLNPLLRQDVVASSTACTRSVFWNSLSGRRMPPPFERLIGTSGRHFRLHPESALLNWSL